MNYWRNLATLYVVGWAFEMAQMYIATESDYRKYILCNKSAKSLLCNVENRPLLFILSLQVVWKLHCGVMEHKGALKTKLPFCLEKKGRVFILPGYFESMINRLVEYQNSPKQVQGVFRTFSNIFT